MMPSPSGSRKKPEKLQESEGDGAAWAAVMFGTIFNQGRRDITAGDDPGQPRRHLKTGLRLVLADLQTHSEQDGFDALAGEVVDINLF